MILLGGKAMSIQQLDGRELSHRDIASQQIKHPGIPKRNSGVFRNKVISLCVGPMRSYGNRGCFYY